MCHIFLCTSLASFKVKELNHIIVTAPRLISPLSDVFYNLAYLEFAQLPRVQFRSKNKQQNKNKMVEDEGERRISKLKQLNLPIIK